MSIAFEAPVAARALLRDACGEMHANLDARLSRIDFNDRSAYADMLSRFSAPLTALEAGLSAGVAPKLLPDWAERRRAAALCEDVVSLGGEFNARVAPAIEDEAEVVGALDVLEGSRLGCRVLARMAEESADADVRGATRYFRHAESAGHWRSFLACLENAPAVRRRPDRAVRAARAAFQSFSAAFA